MSRRILLKIVFVFIIWRVGLILIANVADSILPYSPSFPYATTILPQFSLPRSVYSFANFDGVHYLTIATQGYLHVNYIQAFFPMFPYVLLHLPYILLGASFNPLLIGLFMNSILFLIFLYLWYLYIQDIYGENVAWYSMLVYVLFPTSFYFAALYTESLFMVCMMGSLLCARKQFWFFAAILAGIASATKIVGVCIVPMLIWQLYETYFSKGKNVRLSSFLFAQWHRLVLLSLSSIGLGAYMVFLWQKFADPLFFLHVQSSFGAGRQSNLVLYPQVVYRYLKIFLTVPLFTLKGFAYVQEAVAATIGLIALLFSYSRRNRSYFLFALPAFLIPTLTGNFSSMPRYILVCFPLFIWLGTVVARNTKIRILWFAFATVLLLWNTLLFLQGYWVA